MPHYTAPRTLSRKIEDYLDSSLSITTSNVLSKPGTYDAFSRLRISNPFTLFESQHRYEDNGKWNNAISGTADTSQATGFTKKDNLITGTQVSTTSDAIIEVEAWREN